MGEMIDYRSNGATPGGYLAVPAACLAARPDGSRAIGAVGFCAGHAFFSDDRPEVCNQAAAMLAWDRTLTFPHDKLRSA
jgi:dienelactone hydrolase